MSIPNAPVAIVTGSSRGIGRAIALELAAAGHAVVVNYVSRPGAAEEVVRQIQAAGGQAVAVAGSVADADARQRLVDSAVATFGRLDLLVNNAGVTSPGRKDLLEATEASWDEVFSINLKGAFFLSQLTAQRMISLREAGVTSSGVIVNISSVSAFAASRNRADYCMAKAAMQMMTWLLADRLAEYGIRAYEVCPGVIASDMTAPVQEKYDQLIADGLSPIRRWGEPEDVAKAVAALASERFSFSTGDRIHVDGGYHIRRL
ncbi:3-ketoacyl-ACP reductase [Lignipirellula cremea]|uniref:3-oxoacyl-[acyl-carrier-protein] reductase FabG n=1 Tax=Lignipirellula cremea TaxID=2528010 RepID=A0A518E263_9BACT|nr:3-ketoacyl-ACP reductase [Lignipirellula cremea]QDU98185.1 3-oxoacyl-[acyl-carrier-protein] reductase FabG [Lignipirellula cremea]